MSDTTGTTTEEVGAVERIGQIIAAGGFEVHLERVGEANQQIERLLVSLGSDAVDRKYTVQVFFASDIAEAAGISPDAEDDFDTVTLQFFTVLPFEIDERCMIEAYKMANMASRIAPFGHFGVGEEDGLYYYSYKLVVASREVDVEVIQDIITSLAFAIGAYGPALDNVAQGELTVSEFNDALAEEGMGFLTNPGSA